MTGLEYIAAIVVMHILPTAFFLASRRAGKRSNDFVLGGIAMAAGTTKADRPLHQLGRIHRDGLHSASFCWSQMFAQKFHHVVFARLWQCVDISTIGEFQGICRGIRFSGPAQKICQPWAMMFTPADQQRRARSADDQWQRSP